MLDKEAARAREGKETEEQNLEDFRRKYPWWLNGQGGEATASTGKADSEDTVTLFDGKKHSCVKHDEDDITKGSVSDRTADVVDVVYVNTVT